MRAEAVWDTNPLHYHINGEAINAMMNALRQFNVALEKIEAITNGRAPVMTEKINSAVTGDIPKTKYLLAGEDRSKTRYQLSTLNYPLPKMMLIFNLNLTWMIFPTLF